MSEKTSEHVPVLYRKGVVLAIVFTTTGFLGIPLIVKSPAFNRVEKWVWSIIAIVYTLALFALLGYILWWSYHRIFVDIHFQNTYIAY